MGDGGPRARSVSLTIGAGDFVAVMGASARKSTFMNLVGCLDRPTRGARHLLNGRDVGKLSRSAGARPRPADRLFLPGLQPLPRTSAVENVELPPSYQGVASRERHRRAAEALERVALGDRLDHTPAQLRRPAAAGGHRPGVGNRPTLLLADEPDRQPRLQDQRRGDVDLPGAERAGADRALGDARGGTSPSTRAAWSPSRTASAQRRLATGAGGWRARSCGSRPR